MVPKHFIVVGLVFITLGCKETAVDPLSNSFKRLQAVPQQEWDSLAQKRIYFGHQSVGQNIIEGLTKVLQSVPTIRIEIRETFNPRDFEAPVFAHSRIGQNRDPEGKIDHFRRLLESGIGQTADIAFFKLCYVDIDQATDIESLIDHYDKTLAYLNEKYSKLVIIPVTVPLTNATPGIKAKIKRLLGRGPAIRADNVKRNSFNTHLRNKYGTAIWDLADAEATSIEGTKVAFQNAQGNVFLLNPAYTSDGGHLNPVGSQVIAVDLLIRLASLQNK
jgi:hypothetical protein